MGWQVDLVLPCLAALAAFLPFEKYLPPALWAMVLLRWNPGIINAETWLLLGLFMVVFGLRQLFPLRSWAAALGLGAFAPLVWAWATGVSISAGESAFLVLVSAAWVSAIFFILQRVMKHATAPRFKFSWHKVI